MRFSIIIPARDEEAFLPACLAAIGRAARPFAGDCEVIVVVNRCTDDTEGVARRWGARIVHEDARCLAAIRNAGLRAACGDVIVTIDADSVMSPNLLSEIDGAIRSGRYIGGGVRIRPERWSLGIFCTFLLLHLVLLITGWSGGVFWGRRRDFDAIGGFNEKLVVAEDLDFAQRMKCYGRRRGKAFSKLARGSIVTSCRKFDRFGDWLMVRLIFMPPHKMRRSLNGKDRSLADRIFYDFER